MRHPLAFEPPTVVEIRTDWLHGPVHDWFLVPAWLHAELHRSGIEHHHHRRRSDLHVSPDVDSVDTPVHTESHDADHAAHPS